MIFHHPFHTKFRLPPVQKYCPYEQILQDELECNDMFQCYNSQYLGKDEIFGCLPEQAQEASKLLRSFSGFTLEIYRSFHLHVQQKSIKWNYSRYTQLLLEFKSHQEFLSITVQLPSSPFCCRHNLFRAAAISCSVLFTLLLWSYNGTHPQQQQQFPGLQHVCAPYAPLIFTLALALQKKVQWCCFHLLRRVSFRFQFWHSSTAITAFWTLEHQFICSFGFEISDQS